MEVGLRRVSGDCGGFTLRSQRGYNSGCARGEGDFLAMATSHKYRPFSIAWELISCYNNHWPYLSLGALRVIIANIFRSGK